MCKIETRNAHTYGYVKNIATSEIGTNMTKRWYAFACNETKTVYGWGDLMEATAYNDHLNRTHSDDVWRCAPVSAEYVTDRQLAPHESKIVINTALNNRQ